MEYRKQVMKLELILSPVCWSFFILNYHLLAAGVIKILARKPVQQQNTQQGMLLILLCIYIALYSYSPTEEDLEAFASQKEEEEYVH